MRGTEGLDLSFEKLMVFGGVENMNRSNSGDGDCGFWGLLHGWRDAISWGHTHLSLSWCKKNMNNLVLSLIPKFTKLQVLILRQDTPQLQDDAVEKIADYCHDLQELDLSKSFRLTDRSLYALARGCPDLVKLNISGCSAFSDNALGYLTGFCRKLKILNLCGCVRAATDRALKAIGYNCNKLQSLNLGWCDRVGDEGVKSLAYGCPDLRALDLCGCVLITGGAMAVNLTLMLASAYFRHGFVYEVYPSYHESVVALANNCLHLRSLGLYYCQNITDRAMYSLAQSRVKNKPEVWASVKTRCEEEGLTNLNISQCTALTPPAVQAVCDSFPALHTCPGRHSLIISGCLNLTSVHCACSIHRASTAMPRLAH
ncbi:hypothetical protein DH2020_034264 [Rehmannia glutinosa]|uniref:F-box/LRR-repeat protein 15-like leucin rich repeat domain-containing protein n=1 Tax=Rehmannia glutinosa TaxID=99300 RepID=A0ABR0V9X3_REHGL